MRIGARSVAGVIWAWATLATAAGISVEGAAACAATADNSAASAGTRKRKEFMKIPCSAN